MKIRKTFRRLAALFGAALFAFSAHALVDLSEEIHLPEGTVQGSLDNGLSYIILPNTYPEGRTEFRLIWKVGALQQDDCQGGCAHFLEHMAFGGSKHFPDRGAVGYLESLGMKYGIDINAFTGHDRTIYMFAVPSDSIRNNNYEIPLAIIRDWADALTINPQRVETEKGIILEELRSSFQDDPFYDLKIGQNRFSSRMPLGTPEEVKRMDAKTLRNFYKKWYIPIFGTVVVVGDVDASALEQQIKKQFASLKPHRDPGFTHYHLAYDPPRRIMYDTDSLNSRDEAEIIIPHPTVVTRTLGDLQRKETGSILTAALAGRMHNRGIRADVSDAWYLGDTNHLVFSVRATDEVPLDSMISLLAGEVENAHTKGFGKDEIAYYAWRAATRTAHTPHDGKSSDLWCEDFADYILSGDRYLSDTIQIEEATEVVNDIVASEVDQLFRNWIAYADTTMLVAVKTTPEGAKHYTLEAITEAWNEGRRRGAEEYVFQAPVEKEHEIVPVPEVLTLHRQMNPDDIKDVRKYQSLDIEEITLSNGSRILLKPTKDESGALFAMLGPGGYSSIPPEKMPFLGGAASYIDMGGIAKAGDDLADFMYQNDMAFNTVLENDWHGFLGAFDPKQTRIFANLVYEKITDPELRYDDFEEVRENMLESVGKESLLSRMLNRASDRQLMARMDQLMGNTLEDSNAYDSVGDPLEVQRENISKMNLDSIADFYKGLYGNPAETAVMVCGTFNRDSILEAFVPVLSALGNPQPAATRKYPLLLPESKLSERFPNKNESQTEFDYLFFGDFKPGLRNSLVLKLMDNLLRNRVISEIREKRALVYSPYVTLNYEGIPRGYFYFDINSSCESSRMPAVHEALMEILADLRSHAPEELELDALKKACIIARRETLTPYSPAAWRNIMLSLAKHGESLEDFEKYEEVIKSIRPEEIRDSFREMINPDLYVLLYMSEQEI